MIKALFTTLRARQSIATLLVRADDHLLDDIGLTRFDVEALLREGVVVQPKRRMVAAHA